MREKNPDPINNPPIIIIEKEKMQEKFLKICLEALDTDPTPKDEVSDDVACSQVLSVLIQKLFNDFKIYPSTYDLARKLKMDTRFMPTLTPTIGTIIISPRTKNQFGHCGAFITSERIASNNSFGKDKGKFTGNYDLNSWVKEFKIKRGLEVLLFNIKN